MVIIMSEKRLIDYVIINNKNANKYYFIKNKNNTFIAPANQMKMGLSMYRPSTLKGKFFKKSCIKKPEILLKKRVIESERILISPVIDKYFKKIFETDKINYSFCIGDSTTEDNNKVTVKIFNYKSLGYARIVCNEKTSCLQSNEIEKIEYLKEKNISGIPKIIAIDEIILDDIKFQIRVEKVEDDDVKLNLRLNDRIMDYLRKIQDKTELKIPKDISFEDTDFYSYIEYLKNTIDDEDKNNRRKIKKAIKIIDDHKEEIEMAFSHGDYSPWNIIDTGYSIEAIDFEYANYSMPKYIDAFHYITQAEMLGKNKEIGGIVYSYRNYRKLLKNYIKDTDLIYLCYVVFIISFYKKRTKTKNEEVNKYFRIWIGLLEYLVDKF